MKTSLFWMLLLFTTAISAQELFKTYRFKLDTQLPQVTLKGNPVPSGNTEIINAGWKFTIREIKTPNSEYVIRVSKFTDGTERAVSQNLKYYLDQSEDKIYFLLTKAEFDNRVEPVKNAGNFIVGSSTTLIKIRPGNNQDEESEKIVSEFGNDFNLGFTAGWQVTNWRTGTSGAIVAGVGFSSIKVTPATTRNYLDVESSQSALSFSLGGIFEIRKFQISGFVGIDAMPGLVGENWIYRNRPWIGIGFGYEIFKPQSSKGN